MNKQEIAKYLQETLRQDEMNNIGLVVTCPNCKSKGCKICENGFIKPKTFIQRYKKGGDGD